MLHHKICILSYLVVQYVWMFYHSLRHKNCRNALIFFLKVYLLTHNLINQVLYTLHIVGNSNIEFRVLWFPLL